MVISLYGMTLSTEKAMPYDKAMYITVNTGQPAFEAMAQIVQRVQDMLEEKNDCNGRNQVLSAYIQYSCTLPHPGPMHGKFELFPC